MNNTTAAPYPRPARAWYMVALLTLAYFISYIDRTVIGLLVGPIQRDLGVTDGQMGLLLGLAFGIFYATMGLPLGWLADRTRRVSIVSCAIALWSAATALCGLASNYLQLFLLRMSVGVGEAALSPCTMSMVADSFPKEKRGKAIAVYSMALSLGTATAYYAIGALLDALRGVEVLNWPLVGAIKPWQAVFIIVGVPGLLLALAMLTVREPVRRDVKRGTSTAPWHMLGHFFSRWKTYVTFLLPFCLMTTVAYTHFWMPEVFLRTWGMEAPEFAKTKAIVTLVCAPATVFLGRRPVGLPRASGARQRSLADCRCRHVPLCAYRDSDRPDARHDIGVHHSGHEPGGHRHHHVNRVDGAVDDHAGTVSRSDQRGLLHGDQHHRSDAGAFHRRMAVRLVQCRHRDSRFRYISRIRVSWRDRRQGPGARVCLRSPGLRLDRAGAGARYPSLFSPRARAH